MSSASLLTVAPPVPLEMSPHARHAVQAEDDKAERRLKDAVRRYYALAELIETERGYVDDLRVLVEVYLMSLGAVPIPPRGPRADSQPPTNLSATGNAGPGFSHSTPLSAGLGLHSRPQPHSYQYPPSSFPAFAAVFKDQAEPKRKRARPASLQMLAVLQPSHTSRSRKDSGLSSCNTNDISRDSGNIDREVKVREIVHDDSTSGSGSGSGSGMGIHARTRSMGVGLGNPPSSTGVVVRAGVRRVSADYIPHSQNAYQQTYISSSESSPHPSPLISPSALPSIPSSPLSTSPLSPLPTPSHMHFRHQRLLTALSDVDRSILARSAQQILALHERIVRRVEHALGTVQSEVAERKRKKGRNEEPKKTEKTNKERHDVECEVEVAVRAVCGVFVAEAPNFKPYEAFCAGHTEALDTTRRAMRLHANDWLEWEKYCVDAAVRRESDGFSKMDAETDSPHPSPVSTRPIPHRGSRNSLFSNVTEEAEDARSSTSTPRRRHSACTSSGSIRASMSASSSLKHTKSDPTPPAAAHAQNHSHTVSQDYGIASEYSTLSVKRLSREPERIKDAQAADGLRDRERPRGRNSRTKLSFADYLIKPVQRVCKYPLLFEQLRAHEKKEEADAALTPTGPVGFLADELFAVVTSSVSASRSIATDSTETPKKRKGQAAFKLGGDSDEEDEDSDDMNLYGDERGTNVAIERVLGKMREVARAVDEAKRRRDIEKKSALIVDRLVAGAPNGGSPALQSAPLPPDSQVMDDENGSTEDGRVESQSEVGHGTATVTASTGTIKPPTRSLSFSSAFSRSRSRPRGTFGRTNSTFMQQQQQVAEFGERSRRAQVPGPPTRAFLVSLGACLLAGSLDVVVANFDPGSNKHTRREGVRRDSMLSMTSMSVNGLATASTFLAPPSREPVKVKYLAAFLYVGGYIVLAKIPKAGVYEPRHWFALTDDSIEIVDVREEKALLPCSFHLVFHATGHRLEFAAACHREKEIWLNAMHHARSLPPIWQFEPVPTLNISANLVNTQTGRNSVEVPPIPSMPSMGDDAFAQEINPSRMPSNSTLRTETTIKPNRRQSVNGSGMRAFFMNNNDNAPSTPSTVLIRRVSATRRAQTDRHLADVLSQPLLSARYHAKTHDEILFRDPDPPQQGTGIGVSAMAKNKLMGRESVLVSKQCAPSICSSFASSLDQGSMISDSASSITLQRQKQPSVRGKRSKKGLNRSSLSTLLTFPGAFSDSRTSTPTSQGTFSPDSPIPSTSTTTSIDPLSRSQCSSASTSAPTSSPLNELFPPEVRVVGVDSIPRADGEADGEELPHVIEHLDRPKRSRSLVNNFRGFFGTPRSPSSSPAPSMSSSRQASVEESPETPDAENSRQGNMISRILKGTSLRTRARSTSAFTDSPQTSSSSFQVSTTGPALPTRPSFISRSSSMLIVPRRRQDASANPRVQSSGSSPPFQTSSTLPSGLKSRPSNSSLTSPEARNQKTLGRAIKYRLFPGSFVPLAPIDRPRDRVS